MSGEAAAFVLRSVVKRYGAVTALAGVSLEGRPGECLALVGHNGAGKTTLMKLLLGLVRPSAGTVVTLGAEPTTAPGYRARFLLGFLPEAIAFDAAMTGREVLAFYARLKHLAPKVGEPLLERVGLAAAAGRRVGTYSKGMRQRLGLAQALLGRPRLLLLDEPTTGLDPELRSSFYQLISELKRDGVTVLLSSHALSELEARIDRVAILDRGRLLACGSLPALRREACLPVRLRITVPLCQTGHIAGQLGRAWAPVREDERTLVVTCRPERKMEVLRLLAGLGPAIEDVDTVPAALDELYGHFLAQGAHPS
jgi:Cu-processing system ATP-binding protein